VNGTAVARLGEKADAGVDAIAVDGRPVRAQAPVTYLLNKPPGYVCTSSASQAERRAVDLVPDGRRLYVAGRLDAESQGLLVVTNDGELAQLLTHPRHGMEKEYFVTPSSRPGDEVLKALIEGVRLAEGLAQALSARHHKGGLSIVLVGGMNRQVRRMLAKLGLKVRRLERRRIGFLKLGHLKLGESRRLSGAEVFALKRLARRGMEHRENRADGGGGSLRGQRPRSGPGRAGAAEGKNR
jgi:23S rRNA pseudouridine2605 synthase